LGIDFVIGKLYANSTLAMLNSRRALRGRGQAEGDDDSESVALPDLSELRIENFPSTGTSSGTRTGATSSGLRTREEGVSVVFSPQSQTTSSRSRIESKEVKVLGAESPTPDDLV